MKNYLFYLLLFFSSFKGFSQAINLDSLIEMFNTPYHDFEKKYDKITSPLFIIDNTNYLLFSNGSELEISCSDTDSISIKFLTIKINSIDFNTLQNQFSSNGFRKYRPKKKQKGHFYLKSKNLLITYYPYKKGTEYCFSIHRFGTTIFWRHN